jgi:hypothetical protein
MNKFFLVEGDDLSKYDYLLGKVLKIHKIHEHNVECEGILYKCPINDNYYVFNNNYTYGGNTPNDWDKIKEQFNNKYHYSWLLSKPLNRNDIYCDFTFSVDNSDVDRDYAYKVTSNEEYVKFLNYLESIGETVYRGLAFVKESWDCIMYKKDNHWRLYSKSDINLPIKNASDILNSSVTKKIDKAFEPELIQGKWYVCTSHYWQETSIAKYVEHDEWEFHFSEAYIRQGEEIFDGNGWSIPPIEELREATYQELCDYLPKDHVDNPLSISIKHSTDCMSEEKFDNLFKYPATPSECYPSKSLDTYIQTPVVYSGKKNKHKLVTIFN